MPYHRLTLVKAPKAGQWLVEWDASTLSVMAPDGQPVFEMPVDRVHRIVDLHDLDADYKLNFATDAGELRFKRNKPAARDMRELVQKGMRQDIEWREALRHQARRSIVIGLFLLIVCGSVFGLYCWWSISAPDPPAGSWFYYAGWIIRRGLIILAGLALAGPVIIVRSLGRLRRIRRVEREGILA